MAIIDPEWDEMLNIAERQQQEYYELLPEWTKYTKDEYKYLKQNIAFAIFGPPSEKSDVALCSNLYYFNIFDYLPSNKEIIDIIYNKILEFGEVDINESCTKGVYYGLIYNITFRTKRSSVTKKSTKKKNGEENKININQSPIFKIKSSKFEEQQIWYIDIEGRVYKSWIQYKEKNNSPACTIVLPKDGFYQPDKSCEITEEYSKVWLEILDSPACSTLQTFLNIGDTASSALGVAGIGLVIASMVTPVGPVVLGATVASGATSGLWTVGRSMQKLIDRSSHEQTINPLYDRSALCSWLAITGGTVGLASSGGSVILTKLAANGSNIGNITRVAYNTLLLSNIGINGFGIAHQAYCLYEKYQKEGKVDIADVAFLSAHILFFGNSVMNMQLAQNLIESTQGRILDDYRATLRSRNLRKQFNRANRAAAANNPDKISQNAHVIRYVNNKMELRLKNNVGNIPKILDNIKDNTVSFKNGEIVIHGISLLKPMKFVEILRKYNNECPTENNNEGNSGTEDMLNQLKELLLYLLRNNETEYKLDVNEFNKTLYDLRYLQNATSVLPLIFDISRRLITESASPSNYLHDAVHFIWCYIKENLRSHLNRYFYPIIDEKTLKLLNKIITALYEYMEDCARELSPAFAKYMREKLNLS
ncbi:hypothetical protein E2986_01094 [Frieseomelitta varia]|uniref:DUF4781 domain-containing protein n=1 Tax=Frieseomelitta varia TaxID=561572 RepID=A0A833S3G0_9HYME|nr:uncharacterized protein LOC122529456 [Frieseomelitta varia]KAF3426827.1 hypothetical protein E2986_01094 [Frieseomelitta varia]